MLIQQTGVTYRSDASTPGHLLIAPAAGSKAYLVNHEGQTVHQWSVGPGFTNWAYLLPNGNLFINERCEDRRGVALTGSGLMREYDWQGKLVWEHLDPWQHHDARRLPNGNVVWRYQALDNPQSFFSPHIGGCQRLSSGNTLVCEGSKGCVFEVTNDGKVVWEYVSPYTNAAGEFGHVNWLFRARHYRNDSEELIHL